VHAALAEMAVEIAFVAVAIEQRAKIARRYAPSFAGGTAASSQPSQVMRLFGTCAVAPRPAPRTCQMRSACEGCS